MWFEKFFCKKHETEKCVEVRHSENTEVFREQFIRGEWKPAETKYKTVKKAIEALKKEGFENLVIKTNGESSSHMWTVAYEKVYLDIDDFIKNGLKDYREEEKKHSNGPAIDWEDTSFSLCKKENGVKIRIFIAGEDYTCKESPAKAGWTIIFREDNKNMEFINKIKELLENLDD